MVYVTENEAKNFAINCFYGVLDKFGINGGIVEKYNTYYGRVESPNGNVCENMVFSIESAHTEFRASDQPKKEIIYSVIMDIYNIVSNLFFYDEDRELSYKLTGELMEFANEVVG